MLPPLYSCGLFWEQSLLFLFLPETAGKTQPGVSPLSKCCCRLPNPSSHFPFPNSKFPVPFAFWLLCRQTGKVFCGCAALMKMSSKFLLSDGNCLCSSCETDGSARYRDNYLWDGFLWQADGLPGGKCILVPASS